MEGGDHNFAYLHNVSVQPATGSLKAPQLEVRGPAGMVEGEVHGKHSSQVPGQVSPDQSVFSRKSPAGRVEGELHQFHKFPALDIRFKGEPPPDLTEDVRSASVL